MLQAFTKGADTFSIFNLVQALNKVKETKNKKKDNDLEIIFIIKCSHKQVKRL